MPQQPTSSGQKTIAMESYKQLGTIIKAYTSQYKKMLSITKSLLNKTKNVNGYEYISQKTGKLKDLNAKRNKIIQIQTAITEDTERMRSQFKRLGEALKIKDKEIDYGLAIDLVRKTNDLVSKLTNQVTRLGTSVANVITSIAVSNEEFLKIAKKGAAPKQNSKQDPKKAAQEQYDQMLDTALRLSKEAKAVAENKSAKADAQLNAFNASEAAMNRVIAFAQKNGIKTGLL